MKHTLSANGFSHDLQAWDALGYLRDNHPEAYSAVMTEFPEPIIWSGSWIDTDAMGVDVEWSSWLTDAIEDTGLVAWEDGEPWTVAPTVKWYSWGRLHTGIEVDKPAPDGFVWLLSDVDGHEHFNKRSRVIHPR